MAEKSEYDYCDGEIEVDCACSRREIALKPAESSSLKATDSVNEHDATTNEGTGDDLLKHGEDIETDSIIECEKYPILKHTDDVSIESLVKNTEDLDIRIKNEEPAVPEGSESTADDSDDITAQIYQQDQDGDTYLHCAIISQLPDVALRMIQVAPSHDHLNIYNKRLQTPLHLSVLTDQWEVVRRLVVCGAQLDLCDCHGNTALHLASRDGKESCVWALTSPIQPEEERDVPFRRPQQSIPQDCNTRTYPGDTCLHLAARHKASNYVTIINHLIHHCGADVNKQEGKSGRTILHMCAEDNDTYLLQFLTTHPLAAKLNVNAQTWDEKTAFQLAKSRGHQGVLDILTMNAETETETCQTDDVEDDSDEEYESEENIETTEDCASCT